MSRVNSLFTVKVSFHLRETFPEMLLRKVTVVPFVEEKNEELELLTLTFNWNFYWF